MRNTREMIEFRKRILKWFRQFRRDLPWRRSSDAYRVWLSEIMLQQTRVAAVIPYFQRFLERFPDVRALAEAPEEDVLRLWSGLGYYSRARNLHAAAKQIVAQHGGEFPREPEAALALPGIGPYTVAAILSIAYGAKLAVVDGNVARVIARIEAVRGDLRETRRWQRLQASADALLAPRSAGDWNQAMMELGATICLPRAPQCLLCPVSKSCEARKRGLQDVIPEKRKKRATEQVTLAALVFLDARGQTLLLPPPDGAAGHATPVEILPLVSKMWHFPTIAVRNDPAEELRGVVAGAFGNVAERMKLRLEPLATARHAVTFRAIRVLPFRVLVASLPGIAGARSILLSELTTPGSLAVSNLTRKIARAALAAPAVRGAAS